MLRRLITSAALALVMFLFTPSAARASGCELDNTDPACIFNGGLFLTDVQQPTGTGVIDSFLRLQMKGQEDGFNTDNRQSTSAPSGPSAGVCDTKDCDSKTDPNYTRDIQLGDVRQVTIDGTTYFEFFLDVNEQASMAGQFITLDQLELYVSNSSSPLSGENIEHSITAGAGMNTGGGSLTMNGTSLYKAYDMDSGVTRNAANDNWINIDYNLSSGGSGIGDMVFYVPTSYFPAIYGADAYVFLYSQFGCVTGNGNGTTASCTPSYGGTKHKSGAGFEEWWVLGNGGGGGGGGLGAVPEPGTLVLVGTALGWAARRRRRGKTTPEVL